MVAAYDQERANWSAMILRIGLGIVFIIGGWNKLSQLLDSARHDDLVANYTATNGYINQFFLDYLFRADGSGWLTQSGFLATLSTFELVSGILLVAGLFVRPLALVYAFLLWTFVMALPVTTTPGAVPDVVTFRSPAVLVQIRDIALSGMMFVLFNLGSGAYSLDGRFGFGDTDRAQPSWDNLGLLLRLSIAAILIVGGVFAGGDHIPTFATPRWILIILGILIAGGHGLRWVGGGICPGDALVYRN